MREPYTFEHSFKYCVNKMLKMNDLEKTSSKNCSPMLDNLLFPSQQIDVHLGNRSKELTN
jgi:hypothetical protein